MLGGGGTYRVGMVGAGGIAAAHLEAWQALGVDVAVYSRDGVPELINRCGGGRPARSLDELLSGCDAVDICTPTYTHADLVEQAAAAGCQVFCEKPLARSSVDASRAIDACRRAGVQLYPGHVVRYFPEYAVMHAAVERGDLGQLAVQRFGRIGSAPAAPWFFDRELSGGLVMDQSIHDLDFARWNAGEVSSVFARESIRTSGDTVWSCHVILTHENNAVSYVSGTWGKPQTTFRTTFEIAGTNGLLRHDSRDHQPFVVDGAQADQGKGLLPATPFGESPYLTQIREVYTAFRGGPPPRVTAMDGYEAVRIAESASESLRTGQAVALSPAVAGS